VSRKLRLDPSSGVTLPSDQSTNIGTRVDSAKTKHSIEQLAEQSTL